MKNLMTKVVSPLYAYGLIILAGVIGAYLVFNSASAYYADKIAEYTSQGEAYVQVRNLALQQRIGTGAFIRK